MSDNDGPLMLAATDVLKPPPARIAKLGAGITLPRTVPIRSAVAAGVGAVLSMPFGLLFTKVLGLQAFIFCVMLGGVAGVVVVQWQPQKGETLLQVLGVRAKAAARQQKVVVEGEQVSVSIGTARITRLAGGTTHITAGAVDVNPDTVDERGVLRSAKNRNLLPGLDGRAGFPAVVAPNSPWAVVPEPEPESEIPVEAPVVAVEEPEPEKHRPRPGALPAVPGSRPVAAVPSHPVPSHPVPSHPVPSHPVPALPVRRLAMPDDEVRDTPAEDGTTAWRAGTSVPAPALPAATAAAQAGVVAPAATYPGHTPAPAGPAAQNEVHHGQLAHPTVTTPAPTYRPDGPPSTEDPHRTLGSGGYEPPHVPGPSPHVAQPGPQPLAYPEPPAGGTPVVPGGRGRLTMPDSPDAGHPTPPVGGPTDTGESPNPESPRPAPPQHSAEAPADPQGPTGGRRSRLVMPD